MIPASLNLVAPKSAGRPFSRRFLGVLGGLVLLYLGIALMIDPRRDFGTDLFPAVSLDSRRDKIRLFEEYNRRGAVEGIVLGSSRSMKLACSELDAITGSRWFNFSVDSARAEDYLAIYRWARARDPRLGTLLIGLDVEALHDNLEMDDRLKANQVLMSALDGNRPSAYRRTTDFLGLMKTVFSRYYAQDVLRSLRAALRPAPALMAFDKDGLLHYGLWEGERSAGRFQLTKHLEESHEEYRLRFVRMQGLSARRKNQIETLIMEAQRDRVRVVLWMTPLHPDLAAFLDRETRYAKLLDETRIFAERVRVEFGIPVLDLSTPAAFQGTDSGWYDGGHMDEGNSKRVVDRLATAIRQHGI